MGVRENKDLLRRLHAEGYSGDPDALDRFFSRSYVDHSLWRDLSGLKVALKAFRIAYPGSRWRVDDMIGEGEKVAVRATIEVRAATGSYRAIGSTTVYRFENGKVAETWAHGEPLF